MAFVSVSSDLESGLRTSGHEVDREVSVVNHRYEEVAGFIDERGDLRQVRHPDPVELLLQKGVGDAGEQKFVLTQTAEVEEVEVQLHACRPSPCEDVFLQLVETGLLDVYHHIRRLDLRYRNQPCGYVAGIFFNPLPADVVYYKSVHGWLVLAAMSSRISFFAAFQRGMSILVPTTSTTFAAMIEPTSPQTFRGMPREWA